MAVAGLLIGNAGVAQAMDDLTRDHVLKFWALVDELLNAVLFLLIGLEIIASHPADCCWVWAWQLSHSSYLLG